MLKRVYEKPRLQVMDLEKSDIIATSTTSAQFGTGLDSMWGNDSEVEW